MTVQTEAFIVHREGKQPTLDSMATAWATKLAAGNHIEKRAERRAESSLEPLTFTITRVPAAKGHKARTLAKKTSVIVGETRTTQTWYHWSCECGTTNPDGTGWSHEDMAADMAARHLLDTAGLAKPTPVVVNYAAPTMDTFRVSEGRQGSVVRGMTLVTWTVQNEDDTILRVETLAVDGKVKESVLTDAIAAAYGVAPGLVALNTMKSVAGGPRQGQGVVGNWTPDMAPAVAAAEPTPEVSAAPAESAEPVAEPETPAAQPEIDRSPEGLIALAYDVTTTVSGREDEGEIAGKAFALTEQLRGKAEVRPIRSALSNYSVVATKGKQVIIVPGRGVTPDNWDAVLRLAVGVPTLAERIVPRPTA